MSVSRTILGLWAAAILVVAGCGSAEESNSDAGSDEKSGTATAAVTQVSGDGTEFYQYIPKKKKAATNPDIVEVKPRKVGNDKYEYPHDSKTPEVIAEVQVFSDKSLVFDGNFEEYRSDGKTRHAVGAFKNDRRDGKWTYFHPNGKVAKEVTYIDGRLDGTWTHFADDGAKQVDASYKNGKRHGTWTQYGPRDKEGKQTVAQTTQFTDGLLNGSVVLYYANGQKRGEQRFEMGVPEGVQTQWYQDGTKYVEKTFVKGKLHGVETIWDPKGNILKRREFRNGTPLVTSESEGPKAVDATKTQPASGG